LAKFQTAVFFKGIAMGAADIVPGVSGGTIAFITGIYEFLIDSLQRIPPALFQLLKKRSLRGFWLEINGTFLLTLFSGILVSVFSFSKLISYLLHAYPEMLWGFFFGLIVASVWHVGREIKIWSFSTILLFITGAILAFVITEISPGQIAATPLNLFLGGAIAISAMILPGISGSFILLLLGLYSAVLGAVKNLELSLLIVFASGCLAGLLSIANILAWTLKRYHTVTLAMLTGFMVGALNKVWPWKQTLQFRENSHGQIVPFVQANVSPLHYELLTGRPSFLFSVLIFFILGIALVVVIDKMGRSQH